MSENQKSEAELAAAKAARDAAKAEEKAKKAEEKEAQKAAKEAEKAAKLKEKDVLFCVASGRQYASLRRDFDAYADDMLFICENGALVMQRDRRMLIDPIDPSFISSIVTAAKSLEGVYPVVCRAGVALIEKIASDEFIRNTRMYYPSVEVVADLFVVRHGGDTPGGLVKGRVL